MLPTFQNSVSYYLLSICLFRLWQDHLTFPQAQQKVSWESWCFHLLSQFPLLSMKTSLIPKSSIQRFSFLSKFTWFPQWEAPAPFPLCPASTRILSTRTPCLGWQSMAHVCLPLPVNSLRTEPWWLTIYSLLLHRTTHMSEAFSKMSHLARKKKKYSKQIKDLAFSLFSWVEHGELCIPLSAPISMCLVCVERKIKGLRTATL